MMGMMTEFMRHDLRETLRDMQSDDLREIDERLSETSSRGDSERISVISWGMLLEVCRVII